MLLYGVSADLHDEYFSIILMLISRNQNIHLQLSSIENKNDKFLKAKLDKLDRQYINKNKVTTHFLPLFKSP